MTGFGELSYVGFSAACAACVGAASAALLLHAVVDHKLASAFSVFSCMS
jgi:hypothetical protein